MATLYNQADKNTRLTWLYISGFLVFVIGVGYVFAGAMGNSQILYGAVIFSIIMSFGSYWWSDKIVLVMSGAKELNHENNREMYHLVENLCITAGLPLPKIYLIEDSAPNAFATGRDPRHASIALTTGLIEKLDKVELEGVLAHELSHVRNWDILLSTIAVTLVGIITLLTDWFVRARWYRNGNDRDSSGILVVIGIVLALLAPLFARLLALAVSRKREFLADASGAMLTRYPEGLARALEKIATYASGMRSANRATAHLFIANPFPQLNRSLGTLYSTHPPIEERIKRLRSMGV